MLELGMVGLNEAQARSAGRKVAVVLYDYSADVWAQVDGYVEGLIIIVFYDAGTHRVLRIHAFVEGARDIQGKASLIIRAGLCHVIYSAHQGVEHDNMNLLNLGAQIIGPTVAAEFSSGLPKSQV